MAPVFLVLILIWAAPHERFTPPPRGALFDRPPLLVPALTPAEKSAATSAATSASITKEAARFVSSLLGSTYVAALL